MSKRKTPAVIQWEIGLLAYSMELARRDGMTALVDFFAKCIARRVEGGIAQRAEASAAIPKEPT